MVDWCIKPSFIHFFLQEVAAGTDIHAKAGVVAVGVQLNVEDVLIILAVSGVVRVSVVVIYEVVRLVVISGVASVVVK